MRKIAFFGATGLIGRPVLEELVKAGFEIKALVRDQNKISQNLASKIQIIQGDLQNIADIEKTLEGTESVYLNLSVTHDVKVTDVWLAEREGLNSILALAKKHAIKRVAYLSSLVHRYQGLDGFDWWIFDIKRQAVKSVQQCGIPYTIFYPSTFMEVLDKGGYKNGNKIQLAGKSLHKLYFIAGEDYGRQVAASFRTQIAENQDYAVQGLENFTTDEIAKIFVQKYTLEKLKIMSMPIWVLKIIGFFSTQAHYGYYILTALNKYPEKFESEKTWQDLGKPSISIEKYIEKICEKPS